VASVASAALAAWTRLQLQVCLQRGASRLVLELSPTSPGKRARDLVDADALRCAAMRPKRGGSAPMHRERALVMV
jgi:hypothetical protein